MSDVTTAARRLAELTSSGRHVCVGLDSVLGRLPAGVAPEGSDAERIVAFNSAVVDATADLVCAYKPNVAFYEALGRDGYKALRQTVITIRRIAPAVPVILDAKRADIGSSNDAYVAALFDDLDADAVTVHPYLGAEALAPFLRREDRLVFVLARTSNPGAGELQDLLVDGRPLYEHVAERVARSWNGRANCGLVIGATYPAELAGLRELIGPTMPVLIPGVGSQGGDLQAVVRVHRQARSTAMIINASRSILYASSGADFAEAARAETERMHDAIVQSTGT